MAHGIPKESTDAKGSVEESYVELDTTDGTKFQARKETHGPDPGATRTQQ